jgi:hypothetical protein
MARHAAVSAEVPFTNYRLYRARRMPRTYLVVSTYFDHEGRPEAPDPAAFEERGAIQALLADLEGAQGRMGGAAGGVGTGGATAGGAGDGAVGGDAAGEAAARGAARGETRPPAAARAPRRRRAAVTLRVHGYNARLGDFAGDLLREASPAADGFRPGRRVLIGYRWPSEGVLSARSLRDTARALFFTAFVSLVLLLLPLMALEPHAHRWLAGGETGPIAAALRPLFWPYAARVFAGLLLGAGALLLALRLSTYLRDRYRALHYGVPDLCEFVRDLETGLEATGVRVSFDMVGHSMGSLALVNAVRVMSEFFHRPGAESRYLGYGRSIELRTLILAAPDIPAALASPERNNYFLSSLRRFRSVHILSSDRDIILKWASTLVNWASEPRHDMAGRHLGNAFLARAASVPGGTGGAGHAGPFLPVLRPQVRAFTVLDPRAPLPPHARLAWVHFHDCSACPSLGADGGRPALVSLGVVAAAALLHAWAQSPLTLWVLLWAALLLGLGALARQAPGWRDRWRLGPWLGAFADWPSLAGFGARSNPHGGYFVAGSEPRRLIAWLLAHPARPPAADAPPAPIPAGRAIRTSAVALPV